MEKIPIYNARKSMYSVDLQSKNDEIVFYGGDLNDSKWNRIPDLPIKKIEYNLFTKTIIMQGFEQYNHLIEHVSILNKTNMITKTFLLGLNRDRIDRITFDIVKNKIVHDTIDISEYNKTSGWKTGVTSNNTPPSITTGFFNC